MGACASSSSKQRGNDEEPNPAQKQSSQGTALVVFMDNDHQQEQQQKWKLVSNTVVCASEFPNHVVSEASALWPDNIICAEAPAPSSLYQLRYGEIFYAIPVHRLGTVFTNDDLRSLVHCSLDAMDDSPSFVLSKLQEDELQHSSGPNRDSDMPCLKIATKSHLSPVAECDSELEGHQEG